MRKGAQSITFHVTRYQLVQLDPDVLLICGYYRLETATATHVANDSTNELCIIKRISHICLQPLSVASTRPSKSSYVACSN